MSELTIYRPKEIIRLPCEPQNQVNVVDLRKSMTTRKETRRTGYINVIERCYTRIKRCGSVGRLNCIFDIPNVIIGLPIYDIIECKDVLVDNLRNNGFYIQEDPLDVRRIFIGWSDECLELAKLQQEVSSTNTSINAPQTRNKSKSKPKNIVSFRQNNRFKLS